MKIGDEITLTKTGHNGSISITTLIDQGLVGVYWYGGTESKQDAERIKTKGLPPVWVEISKIQLI